MINFSPFARKYLHMAQLTDSQASFANDSLRLIRGVAKIPSHGGLRKPRGRGGGSDFVLELN